MNIREFHERFASDEHVSAESLCDKWEKEKQVDDFLGMEVASGVMVADLLHGDGSLDQISPELRDSFAALMQDKADSYHEIRQILFEKLEKGDDSVSGTINKIKGQVGENRFLEECTRDNIPARLAESGSQPGWDVAVEQSDGTTQYVQVKMYSDEGNLVEKLQELQDKIDAGEIMGTSGEVVTDIDIAVSSNIEIDEVQSRMDDLGLGFDLIPMETSSTEAAEVVREGFANVGPEAVENLFGQLLGASVAATTIHSLTNAFLVYKGSKASNAFLCDTVRSSSISITGIGAGMGAELVLNHIAWIGGPPTFALTFATSFSTRAIAKRLMSRGDSVTWLIDANEHLDNVVAQVQAA